MFGFLKGKNKEFMIGSPVKGKAVPISEVNDPTFARRFSGGAWRLCRKTEKSVRRRTVN